VRFYLVAVLFILFDVEAVFMMPWAVIYRKLPAITGSRLFGFWEMVVYLGFVGVGLYYIARKASSTGARTRRTSDMADAKHCSARRQCLNRLPAIPRQGYRGLESGSADRRQI